MYELFSIHVLQTFSRFLRNTIDILSWLMYFFNRKKQYIFKFKQYIIIPTIGQHNIIFLPKHALQKYIIF